eukprot:7386415-Prymnesium_polylepis.1
MSAWSALDCDLPSGNWSACGTTSYHEHRSKLANGTALSIRQLRVPPHTRLLFFGFSYLRQVADELFCADSTIRWRFLASSGDGPWRQHDSGAEPSAAAEVFWTHGRLKWMPPLVQPTEWHSAQQHASAVL